MTVCLNVDLGLKEARKLLQEHSRTEFACVETKSHSAPQLQLKSIFEGLSQLTHVKQLFVKKLVNLFAQSVANVLNNLQRLEFLYLQNVKLSGEEDEFQALADAIEQHPTLRKCRLYMCRPSIRANATFDPIITALSNARTLEEVTMIHCTISTEEQDNWEGKCLRDLCRSKKLKILTLTCGPELKDEHIEMMAEALQTNKTLESVSIRANKLGASAGMAMSRVLKTNRTLERLRVQLSSDEFAGPIVEALHDNKNLQKLGLILPNDVNQKVREQLTLEMTQMLRKSNYNLKDVDLVGWKANNRIRFYLKLNQTGRRSLLAEGATRDQWAKTLVSHKDDVSIIYYFLKRNPQLCLTILNRMISLTNKSSSSLESRKRVAIDMMNQTDGSFATKRTKLA